MAHFIITFRIGSDPGYQTRYESFVKKIHELGGGIGKVWEETTSFASLQSPLTAEALCQALYLGSEFNSSSDIMVVIDLDAKVKATKGKVNYLTTLTATLGF